MAERNIKESIGTPTITDVDYSSAHDSIRLKINIPILDDNKTIGRIDGTIVLDDVAERFGANYKNLILNNLFSELKQRQNTNKKYGFFIFDCIAVSPTGCDYSRVSFKEIKNLIPPLLSEELKIRISFMVNEGENIE